MKAAPQVAHLAQGTARDLIHLFVGLPVEGHYDRLLGWEVVVGSARGDIRLARDVPHRGLGEAPLLEEGQSGCEDATPRILGFRRGPAAGAIVTLGSTHDRAFSRGSIGGLESGGA